MKITQLNHVAIHVEDVARADRFYEDVLGLQQIDRPAFGFPGTWFRLGDNQELHLIARENPEIDYPWDRHFALMVDDIEAFEQRLKEKGIEYRAPNRRPDGAIQIFLRDPDGHAIELCTAPTS